MNFYPQNTGQGGQIYYDAKKGQFYTLSGGYNIMGHSGGGTRTYIGDPTASEAKKKAPLFGTNTGTTAPAVDFNALPQIGMTQNQPYQRPAPPPGQPPAYTPQFDMQALMQAIQARQAMMGQPRQGTLTPGAPMNGTAYGPDAGGLAALRAIAAGAPSAGQ